ncbi:MAG: response regulator, partial [Bacteroidota bacterium]
IREKPAVAHWDQKWQIARGQASDAPLWQPSESSEQLKDRPLVLVVEDNTDLRRYIEYILRDQYHIVTKENGLAALQWLRQAQASIPDLIVSDIMMPKIDGLGLLHQLKGDSTWKTIPVIMLTARAGTRDKVNALRTGVDDYLTKPFIEEELLARMENLLRHAQSRRQWLDKEAITEESSLELTERSQEEEQWLIRLENIVEAQIGESTFTVEQLAQKLFVSRRQLQRRIRTLTGLTPNQYITEFRLQTAREMLEHAPNQTIKSVAFKVGIRDVKYFSQQFKKRFGRLPSSYRNDQQA